MINIRPVLLVIGMLLLLLSLAMLIPAFVDLLTLDNDWKAFVAGAFCTAFVGGALVLTNRTEEKRDINVKQVFLLTTLSWVVICAFAALPLMFSAAKMSFTDAYFEAMSGMTTTGSTVLVGLDTMPRGILLWRAMLTGLGGMGIIVMGIAILPILKVGGMQLFKTEASTNQDDKSVARATQLCGAIIWIYILLTATTTFALWIAGMTFFDAICHAMPAISTAGFGNYDMSIGHFNSTPIYVILTLAMFAGSLPFVLYIQIVQGRTGALWRDSQVQWFTGVCAVSILLMAGWLVVKNGMDASYALRDASFNVISIISTTGFITTDYNMWGTFPVMMFFMLSVVGGCTGSTTGGIKIFRHQVLFQMARTQISKLVRPHGVFLPLYNKKPISDEVMISVTGFVVLYILTFVWVSVGLSLTGLDMVTSMSATTAALGNVGPGLGDIVGPVGNFKPLSDTAKWMLSGAMLLGRLEIFTVLVLFSRHFWRS